MSADTNDPVRVALIGYGLGGRVFHAPLISSVPGLSPVTIVTSDPTRQAEARESYPSARVLDRPEAVGLSWMGTVRGFAAPSDVCD